VSHHFQGMDISSPKGSSTVVQHMYMYVTTWAHY